MNKRALVLGGGGVAGIAWTTGVLVGMADAGVDVRTADLILGTSAGACVGAQITSGLSMDALFQRQVDPALQVHELYAQLDWTQMAKLERIQQESRTTGEMLQRVGALALATPTVSEVQRRAVIASRLPVHRWPPSPLAVVAIDIDSGERVVFERESHVNLVDAVAASCAVPCVWRPVTIDGRRYIDGGTFSLENVDLAAGFERVLVVQPDPSPFSWANLQPQVEQLRANHAQVEVVAPDEAMKAIVASVGGNLLDPSVRDRAARAGRAQGCRVAPRVASLWRQAESMVSLAGCL